QNAADNAVSTAKQAISSMKAAGYSQTDINNANYDLETAKTAQSDIATALQDANDQASTEASYAKAMALAKSLSQSISQLTEQLNNFSPVQEELNLDSKILSESFAFAATPSATSHSTTSASYAPAAAGSKASPMGAPLTSSEWNSPSAETSTSSNNLAVTGSSAEEAEIASAVLLASGIAVEAIKKSRGKHIRNK
ncbi:MAG: hypothetical protein J6P35_00025, partial [Aeriscardovia sp.]|nr:hypothetical protein [Aeriscardovia sp.]